MKELLVLAVIMLFWNWLVYKQSNKVGTKIGIN